VFFSPSGGDGLLLSVEEDTSLTVEVEISSEGVLVTGEGEHGQGDGDGNVDTDLTGVDFVLELSGEGSGSGEEGATITPTIFVDELDGFFESVDSDDTEDGAKDFFIVALHTGLNVVEDSGADEVTLGVFRMDEASTIEGDLGAFLFSLIDVTNDSFLQSSINERAEVDTFISTDTDLELFCLFDQIGDPVLGFTDEDGSSQGHASLSSGTESSTSQSVQSFFLIGIGEDDTVVLGTHVGLNSLTVLATFVVNVFTCLVRADERDSSNAGMFNDVVDGIVTTVDQVNNTLGELNVLEELGQKSGGTSDLFGGLQDVGVTAGDTDGEHPKRNHDGEVEGGNAGADTEGNSVTVQIDASGDVFTGFTHHDAGEGQGVFNDFHTSLDVTSGIDQGLSLFSSDDLGQFFVVFSELHQVVEHVTLTDEDGDISPGLEGFFSRSDGFVEFFVSGLGNLVDEFLSGGVVDVEPFSGFGFLEFTVDEVLAGSGESGGAESVDGLLVSGEH